MNWVIDQGWALYWGTSEWSAEQLQEVRTQQQQQQQYQ
jgi:aryl-alcohol dehydrogenase-like predicted oxidoreductase